jgi:hypothetical protein
MFGSPRTAALSAVVTFVLIFGHACFFPKGPPEPVGVSLRIAEMILIAVTLVALRPSMKPGSSTQVAATIAFISACFSLGAIVMIFTLAGPGTAIGLGIVVALCVPTMVASSLIAWRHTEG